MEPNTEKVDEIVLALLFFNSWSEKRDEPDGTARAWKSLNWDALDRLNEKGLISDPKSKSKSVVLSAEGFKLAGEMFKKHLV